MAIHNPVTTMGVNASGDSEATTVIGGAAYVLGDAGTGYGFPQNRVDSGLAATRRTMTWPSGEGPTKINAFYESGTSPVKTYIVVNALNDTHAAAELADPVSRDGTQERYTVFATSVAPDGKEIASVTPIERLDYLMSGADASSILIVEGA